MTRLEEVLAEALQALRDAAPDDVEAEDVDELEERLRAQGWRI